MGSPTIGGNSRQGTPPLVHALGMPGSGIGFTGKPGALVAAGPASSAGPSGGLPARGMANPTGPQLFGQRQGTPPGMPKESLAGPRIASSTSGLVGESMGVVRFEAVPGMHSTPLAQGTGSSSLSVFGLSGPASPTSPSGFGADGAMPTAAAGSAGPGASPLRLPPGAADDIRSSSSMALSADGRHPGFLHANSASMSPSSFRLHHVGLASGGSSPTDAPLELIPQDYYGPRQASSPSRRGPLQPLRQNSSAAMSMPLNPGIGGDASLTLPDDAMVPRRLVMDPASQSVPVWRKQPDLPSESSTRATEQSTPTPSRESSQVPRPPLHKSPTSPVLSNGMSGMPADRDKGLSASKTASSFRQVDELDAPMERVQTSPATGGNGLDASQKVMSWARQPSGANAPKPLTNGALGRGRLPPSRSYTTPALDSNVDYVTADPLPRLPPGKVKKAAPTPSWMSAIF